MSDNKNIIDELQWRGLINQSTDLEALKEATEALKEAREAAKKRRVAR